MALSAVSGEGTLLECAASRPQIAPPVRLRMKTANADTVAANKREGNRKIERRHFVAAGWEVLFGFNQYSSYQSGRT